MSITEHPLGSASIIVLRCLQNDDIMNLEGLKRIKLIMPPISMSEDCLYLNVYTPAHAREGSNLPVRVGPRSTGWEWRFLS